MTPTDMSARKLAFASAVAALALSCDAAAARHWRVAAALLHDGRTFAKASAVVAADRPATVKVEGEAGYSLSLAGELRRAGKPIEVSVLCPDAIAGDMTNAVAHDDAAGLIFSAGTMLTLDEVADAAVELVDDPKLVRTMPRYRAALAHLLRPFPALGLPLLEQFAKLGRRRAR